MIIKFYDISQPSFFNSEKLANLIQIRRIMNCCCEINNKLC